MLDEHTRAINALHDAVNRLDKNHAVQFHRTAQLQQEIDELKRRLELTKLPRTKSGDERGANETRS
jgi:hypothetical protein